MTKRADNILFILVCLGTATLVGGFWRYEKANERYEMPYNESAAGEFPMWDAHAERLAEAQKGRVIDSVILELREAAKHKRELEVAAAGATNVQATAGVGDNTTPRGK